MKISAPAFLLPVSPKGLPVKTGSVGLPKATGMTVPVTKSVASAQTYASQGVTQWSVGRPYTELSATTGPVTGQATSVPMTLSLKKGAQYSFAGASSYSYTGGKPVVSITLTDASGKVVSSSKSNSLSYVATANGNYTVTMAITPAKKFTAQFTGYILNANQTLSKLPVSSGDKYVDAVLAGGSNWWHPAGDVATPTTTAISPTIKQIEGARRTIYYGFLSGSETYLSSADVKGFGAIDNEQKTAIRSAFDYLSSLINVEFLLDDSQADIRFGNNDQTASAGYANYPSPDPNWPSKLMLDNSSNPQNAGANLGVPGSYGWQTLIHEIGHSMGLKHPGAYNAGGGTTAGPYLPAAIDNRAMSIMSYKNPTASNIVTLTGSSNGSSYRLGTANPYTFQTFDIAALQYIYGANTSTTTDALPLNDSYSNFQTLWAPKGVSLDASGTSRANLFDLRSGGYSSISVRTEASNLAEFKAQLIAQQFDESRASAAASSVIASLKAQKTYATLYNGKNSLALSYGSKFSNVVGGSAADKFYAGNYSTEVDGGQGSDTLYLIGAAKDWVIDRSQGTATAKSGGASIKFRGIEAINYYKATEALLHA